MAIRIRWTGERFVALCATESLPGDKDIYLNDGIHTALTEKFTKDFEQMGLIKKPKS